jgi:uncharacterized protein
MNQKQRQILLNIELAVKRQMSKEGTGHDWWHVSRVLKNSKKIAASLTKADSFLIQAAALLHDIRDWKFSRGDEEAGPREADRLLKKYGTEKESRIRVSQIIRELSYKGAGVKTRPSSLEGKIVQDADRLDAMGAIGIARCFAYGGSMGREIYNPAEKPKLHKNFAAYKKSKGHSINHFYEKLLLLKSRMNTLEGRRLAVKRDSFMRSYLQHFYQECSANS